MTRAEAIGHLKNIAIYSFQDGYTDEARQALDMAIKALEEPRTANLTVPIQVNLPDDWVEQVVNELRNDPDFAERKKGRWVKHDTGHSIYYDCSLCGCVAPCTEVCDSFIWKLSTYCPDCGAKMRGDDNGTV